jgi:hypothetical protein
MKMWKEDDFVKLFVVELYMGQVGKTWTAIAVLSCPESRARASSTGCIPHHGTRLFVVLLVFDGERIKPAFDL